MKVKVGESTIIDGKFILTILSITGRYEMNKIKYWKKVKIMKRHDIVFKIERKKDPSKYFTFNFNQSFEVDRTPYTSIYHIVPKQEICVDSVMFCLYNDYKTVLDAFDNGMELGEYLNEEMCMTEYKEIERVKFAINDIFGKMKTFFSRNELILMKDKYQDY